MPAGLINPDEYLEDEEEEYEPQSGQKGKDTRRLRNNVISVRAAFVDRPERRLTLNIMLSKLSVEDVSLELAIRHEEERGCTVEDRHRQRGIGYDLLSIGKQQAERFIEVKGFATTLG